MAGHIGSTHLPIDVIAHQAVERFVYATYPGHVQVIGEETRRSMWTPVGGLVVTVDPVDGTGPAVDLGFGWSTVVLVHRLARPSSGGRTTWRLVGAAIADSSDHVISYVRPGIVVMSTVHDSACRRVRVRPSRSSGAVAAVGAKHSARTAWTAMASGFNETGYNLGGTPTAWGLVVGRLAASIVATPSTLWDAAHVLLGSQAGGAVMSLESGLAVPASTVLEWFSTPQFEDGLGGGWIEPCVVAADNDAAVSARSAYARAETTVVSA